jgi:hypothetical protein
MYTTETGRCQQHSPTLSDALHVSDSIPSNVPFMASRRNTKLVRLVERAVLRHHDARCLLQTRVVRQRMDSAAAPALRTLPIPAPQLDELDRHLSNGLRSLKRTGATNHSPGAPVTITRVTYSELIAAVASNATRYALQSTRGPSKAEVRAPVRKRLKE